MYALRKGNETLGFTIPNSSTYVLGFNSVKLARKVQYNMQPFPKFVLKRGKQQLVYNETFDAEIKVETDTKLIIPKFKGSYLHPLNDGCFHMESISYEKFLTLPYIKLVGIVIPNQLEAEDDDSFHFNCVMLDPVYIEKVNRVIDI